MLEYLLPHPSPLHPSIPPPPPPPHLTPPARSSFSFPSGHTSSATFLTCALLFVLLPLAARTRLFQGSSAMQWLMRLQVRCLDYCTPDFIC